MADRVELARCPIRSERDLPTVRKLLRAEAEAVAMGLVQVTKFVTAGSELARNIIKYAPGAGGSLAMERLDTGRRHGIRATFSDAGPGIPDMARALTDGFSTAGSLGIGLPGARRLVDEFSVESSPGHGTTVVIVSWRQH